MAIMNTALRNAVDAYRGRPEPAAPGGGVIPHEVDATPRGLPREAGSAAGRPAGTPAPVDGQPVEPAEQAVAPQAKQPAAPSAKQPRSPLSEQPAAPSAKQSPPTTDERDRRASTMQATTRRTTAAQPPLPTAPSAVAHPAIPENRPDRWESTGEWRLYAECGPGDTELFFSKDPVEKRAALAICGDCPVARECLAEVMAQEKGVDLHGRYGIRGGLTPSERRDLSREQQRQAAMPRSGRSRRTGAA